MKDQPLISVIMPTFNDEKIFLTCAVQSILEQKYKNIEFIIVDDGNSDICRSYLAEVSRKDSRVHIILNKERKGLASSLNYAIRIAKGKYIARMDADDISLPDRLEKQILYLEKNIDIDILGTNMYIIDAENKEIGRKYYKYNYDEVKKDIWRNSPLGHPTVMYRTDIIKKIGGYSTGFLQAEDYELWLRALNQGIKICNMPEFLLKYRIVATSYERRGKNIFLYDIKIKWKYRNLSILWLKGEIYSIILYITYSVPDKIRRILKKIYYLLKF